MVRSAEKSECTVRSVGRKQGDATAKGHTESTAGRDSGLLAPVNKIRRFWHSGANAGQTSSLVARFGAGSDNPSHHVARKEAQSTQIDVPHPRPWVVEKVRPSKPAQMGFPLERECLE